MIWIVVPEYMTQFSVLPVFCGVASIYIANIFMCLENILYCMQYSSILLLRQLWKCKYSKPLKDTILYPRSFIAGVSARICLQLISNAFPLGIHQPDDILNMALDGYLSSVSGLM